MAAVMFYHLTQRPLEATLRMLVEKSRGRGWRVLVRGGHQDHLTGLDQALWDGPADGFLPHGLAGGAQDADQPVLLTTDMSNPNASACLMSVHGAEVRAEDAAQFERVCILFDGHDDAALAHARTQWKALTGVGTAAQYWSEASGRWEMQAQANGSE